MQYLNLMVARNAEECFSITVKLVIRRFETLPANRVVARHVRVPVRVRLLATRAIFVHFVL